MNGVRRIVRVAMLALASLAVFLNVPAFSDFVLCLGGDGHFEVEYSVGGKCGESSASDRAAGEASLHSAGEVAHCGACTDVSLMISMDGLARPGQAITAGSTTLAALPAASAAPLGARLEPSAPERLSPRPPPTGCPHLAHWRTIRLLV